MKEQLATLLEKPAPTKMAVLIATILGVLAIYWFGMYGDLANEMAELETQTANLKTQVAQKRDIEKDLKRFESEVVKLDEELQKALQELPDKREISSLLAKISDRARDAGLDVELFQPKPDEKQELFASVPVQIEVVGTYHQVATFFDEVGHLDRIVNLTSLLMTQPVVGKDDVQLRTSVVATAFRFLDESERPKVEDAKEKGKRRGAKKTAEE